jgi:hypothetical protein
MPAGSLHRKAWAASLPPSRSRPEHSGPSASHAATACRPDTPGPPGAVSQFPALRGARQLDPTPAACPRPRTRGARSPPARMTECRAARNPSSDHLPRTRGSLLGRGYAGPGEPRRRPSSSSSSRASRPCRAPAPVRCREGLRQQEDSVAPRVVVYAAGQGPAPPGPYPEASDARLAHMGSDRDLPLRRAGPFGQSTAERRRSGPIPTGATTFAFQLDCERTAEW